MSISDVWANMGVTFEGSVNLEGDSVFRCQLAGGAWLEVSGTDLQLVIRPHPPSAVVAEMPDPCDFTVGGYPVRRNDHGEYCTDAAMLGCSRAEALRWLSEQGIPKSSRGVEGPVNALRGWTASR